MNEAIESAIHLLRQALATATTDTDATRKTVQAAVKALSPILSAPGLGPDDIPGTSTRSKTG